MKQILAGVANTLYERPLWAFGTVIFSIVIIALLAMPL